MSDLEQMCRDHFNEPIIVSFDVVRLIGYAEDDDDCYLVCQRRGGAVFWNTCVGGYVFLDRLKGQECTKSGWDDFTRLDSILALNGSPESPEFKLEIQRSEDRHP